MLYWIGLVFVILVIFIGIDDLLWDVFYILRFRNRKNNKQLLNLKELFSVPTKLFAVAIGAYKEEAVIFDVVENLILSNLYPRSMYHVFIGVYPNDEATQLEVDRLSAKYPNVHKVVHVLDGPSSKADNINNIVLHMTKFEKKHQIQFSGFVLHDAEDVIHPYEFLVENYLFSKHAVIQMPVFPLQEYPRLRNVFKKMISGTYADEFAENHYSLLVARNTFNAFVPSAGTGFALRRDIWEKFDEYEIFPVGSLTEDYKLSLQLKQMGIDVHYPLTYVTRVMSDKKVRKEFVSTRSLFPQTYALAVRQKTRWIYGITMQSFSLRDIIKNRKLSFVAKYSLYKDWKAKFGNLLLGPGYIIFAYFVVSLFIELPVMYPKYSLSWYLMLFLTIMMIQRQIFRFRAVINVYGLRSALVSTLFPVLLPIRLVIGNVVNFHATVNAWRRFFFDIQPKNSGKKTKWNKTDHEFLPASVLRIFFRTLGDTLIFFGFINHQQLKKGLSVASQQNIKVGEALMQLGYINEIQLVRTLAFMWNKKVIELRGWMISHTCSQLFTQEDMLKYEFVPLLLLKDQPLIAITFDSNIQEITRLLSPYVSMENASYVYVVKKDLTHSLVENQKEHVGLFYHLLTDYLKDEQISMEQYVVSLTYVQSYKNSKICLEDLGLYKEW